MGGVLEPCKYLKPLGIARRARKFAPPSLVFVGTPIPHLAVVAVVLHVDQLQGTVTGCAPKSQRAFHERTEGVGQTEWIRVGMQKAKDNMVGRATRAEQAERGIRPPG